MPLPILGILAGALGAKALEEKKVPVSGRKKKDGTRSKAYLRKARKK